MHTENTTSCPLAEHKAAPSAPLLKAGLDPALHGHWLGPSGTDMCGAVCDVDVKRGGDRNRTLKCSQGWSYRILLEAPSAIV